MKRYAWATWGDINAFFGLMLDNVAVMVLFVSLIAGSAAGQYTPQFVLTRMIPGTALGVLLGDLVYTWLAFRLARRRHLDNVTAMPLGLDTPSTFGIALFVMLPALAEGNKLFPGDRDRAMHFGWHVGAVVLVLVGAVQGGLRPLGNAVRRWVPRAGLLGSLAAIALVLIAFLPLLTDIAAVPLVGMAVLTVILVTLVAHRALPYKVPGALAAVVLGVDPDFRRPLSGPGVRHAAGAGGRINRLGLLAAFAVGVDLNGLGLVVRRSQSGAGKAAGGAAVRPGDDRRRHRLHRERGGGRRRVRHARRSC